MKYRLSQIAAVVGGRFSGTDCEVQSVVTDSRSLTCELGSGPVFVAMCGANHDSHAFVAQMYARGVRAFMVERPLEALPECGYVVVENAIAALQCLAAYHRAQFRGTVVGITGSNGKTVIKEWIAEELPAGMKCYRSPKSYNSQLGVPLSVLMIEGDEQLALIEAGISKPGEMARLERIIRPDVVVFTSIGDAHQENFLNLEQKCDEKMVLAHRAETIVYHSYYEPLGRMIASRFAGRKLCDAASCPEVPETLIGNEASRRNARIVEAFCAAMGYPAPSFTEAPEVAMRLEVKDGINDSVLINDAYNLDLNSLALALDYLHNVALSRRRTLVLSDIAQSGLTDDELYGRVAGMVARAGIDTPRRHRSQTEALRRAVRLRQGVLRLDRRVHLPHRPQGRGRACRLVERRAGVPFRETRACAGAQEPHDGAGGRSRRHDPQPKLFPLEARLSDPARGDGQGGFVRRGGFRGGADAPASGRRLPRRGVRRRGRAAARAGGSRCPSWC